MNRLTAKTAVAKAAMGEITLLDVREANELHASGKAKDALHIPLAMIPLQAADRISKSKPVAIYCAAGGRAGMAAQALQQMGYDAHNIGGFADWTLAGGAISR
jgi:rhodanese-related sulfurtransferase